LRAILTAVIKCAQPIADNAPAEDLESTTSMGACMANRSYLYSLSNQPTSHGDRPETISGLSEWAYNVPFMYRLLMSGDPQLCASLISDGLDDSDMPLYAISGPFDAGFERVKRFAVIVKALIALPAIGHPIPAASEAPNPGFTARLRRWVGLSHAPTVANPASVSASTSTRGAIEHLPGLLDETIVFLQAHRNQYLLLETIELDVMSESEANPLRALVEAEMDRCRHVAAAFDALPQDPVEAAHVLQAAATEKSATPLDAFFGLRFDDHCDGTRARAAEYPLGLEWSDALYFDLFNREQFEAQQNEPY